MSWGLTASHSPRRPEPQRPPEFRTRYVVDSRHLLKEVLRRLLQFRQ